jgi:hypothetical protein
MTIEEYWAEIHQMGLTPTRFRTLFKTRDGGIQYPALQTPAQRVETVDRIKFMLGM